MGSGSVKPGALIGERLGKYDLLALLAIGGTAEIYLARIGGEAGFEKYVVVKCLLDHLADDAEFVRMFLDEARLGAQLDHSNIVQTLELGEHKGRYYMVMEYLAGMSLAQLARKSQQRAPGGLIPIELNLGLAAQACSGLHYAHQRASPDGTQLNMVHRDISPQNLVVSFEGVLKIVDFGIAKADVRQTNTQDGTIKGKFAYMSPEQCLAKKIDRRTDIFALGVIVHELLTGRRLFKRSTTYETYQAIVSGKVPKPSTTNPKIDPKLDDVVIKALEYDREKRYPNAESFGEALLGYLHGRGKSVSASDVSQYFDRYFAAELDEHAARMRELISGRAKTAAEQLTWDNLEPGEGPKKGSAAPLTPAAPVTPGPKLGGGKQTALKNEPEDDGEDEEGDGDGATRIELNPLGRFTPQPDKKKIGAQSRQADADDWGEPEHLEERGETMVFDPESPRPQDSELEVTGETRQSKPRRDSTENPTVSLEPKRGARAERPGASSPSGRRPTQIGTGVAKLSDLARRDSGGGDQAAGPRSTGASAEPASRGPQGPGGPVGGPPKPPPGRSTAPGPAASPPQDPSGSGAHARTMLAADPPGVPSPGSAGPAPGAPSGPPPGAPSGPAPGAPSGPPPGGAPSGRSGGMLETLADDTPPPGAIPPGLSGPMAPPVGPAAPYPQHHPVDIGSGAAPQLPPREAAASGGPPFWLLAVVFLLSAGFGLGATVLIVKLIA